MAAAVSTKFIGGLTAIFLNPEKICWTDWCRQPRRRLIEQQLPQQMPVQLQYVNRSSDRYRPVQTDA